MTVEFVAVNYPRPTLVDEFVARAKEVVLVMRTTPGCLSAA